MSKPTIQNGTTVNASGSSQSIDDLISVAKRTVEDESASGRFWERLSWILLVAYGILTLANTVKVVVGLRPTWYFDLSKWREERDFQLDRERRGLPPLIRQPPRE